MLSANEYVRKHLRFNFAVGLLDGGFFGLGMGFGSFVAIIPLFVSHLTDSALLIGLVPAIHNMGWQLPQLLLADRLSKVMQYKPLTLLMTIHERVPYLGLAALAFGLAYLSKPTAVWIAFAMLVWQGFGGGLAANPWTNMMSRVIPQDSHGVFFGAQAAALNALQGVAALLASWLLARVLWPASFGISFTLTFVSMVISFIFLAAIRERAEQAPQSAHSLSFWHRTLETLKHEGNFRAFLLVRVLSQFAGMGFAFYIIYAVRRFALSDAAATAMVSILLIGQVILGPVMGRLGDRWSHRGMMTIGALGASLSAVLAWLAPSASWLPAILLFEAVAVVAIWTVPIALSVSFAPTEAERPLYIGMSNTLVAPATILAPAIGGWIADAASFQLTFQLSAVFGLLMAAALWFGMREPSTSRS